MPFLDRSAPRDDQLLQLASLLVIALAVLLALPAFFVPLGLPIEGDAVDYRVPLIRWMIRHGSYPNWPWTMVDDYPSAGELLMLPFYAIHPALARIVPLLGYLGFGAGAGLLARRLGEKLTGLSPHALFLAGCAWALSLRPAALQANALMNDTLAAAFLMGAVALLLEKKFVWAAVCAAFALGTRYSTWGSAAFLPAVAFFVSDGSLKRKLRSALIFCLVAGLGALPFLTRNFLVNDRHAFFPVDAAELMAGWGVFDYGRGTDLVSFLLLPFDLLYTNSFVRGFFDYTLGKLFYVQLAAVALAIFLRIARRGLVAREIGRFKLRTEAWLAIGFTVVHLVVWFRSSQQLRFLLPVILLVNLAMLIVLARAAGPRLVAAVTAAGVMSLISVQMDSIRIALGREPSPYVLNSREAADCFARAGVGQEPVGYLHRDGMLGYFSHDYTYLPGHTYSVPGKEPPPVRWIYATEPRAGYVPWPVEDPCILKRAEL